MADTKLSPERIALLRSMTLEEVIDAYALSQAEIADKNNGIASLDKQVADLHARLLEMQAEEMPELPCCPVHESLLRSGSLTPFDNCIVCTRNHRDELQAELSTLRRELEHRNVGYKALSDDSEALQLEIAALKAEAVRFERPAIRWRAMRKAVTGLCKYTVNDEADGGWNLGVNAAIRAIDRIANADVPDTDTPKPVGWLYKVILNKHLTGPPLGGQIQVHGVWGDKSDGLIFAEKLPSDRYIWWSAPVYLTPSDTDEVAALKAENEKLEKECAPERILKRQVLDKFADHCIQRNGDIDPVATVEDSESAAEYACNNLACQMIGTHTVGCKVEHNALAHPRTGGEAVKTSHIVQDNPDEHVFIVIECPGRPAISIDVTNCHCRRGVGVRVDGMGIFHALVDLKELGPKGETLFRYCGMCGEKIRLSSSRGHECQEDKP